MRWRTTVVALLVALSWVPLCGRTAAAERRVALVIGNGAYAKVTKLPNPARDAAAIAVMLKGAGFEVTSANDLSGAAMRRVLRDFTAASRDADIAAVFYAGHGMEVNGTNYLIPVDAVLERDIDVEDEAVPLDRVSQVLEPAKRLRLVILDACRDNPFVRSMTRTVATRSIGRGLAKVEVLTTDTLFAYAARAGSTAEDGDGQNSPFTAALVKHLATPGLDLRIALGRVRDEVLAATARRQEPFVYGSLGGAEVALVASEQKPPAGAVQSSALSAAAEAWDRIKDTSDAATLEAFQRRFGDTFYGDMARQKLAALKLKAGEQRDKVVMLQKEAANKKAEDETVKTRDPALGVKPGSGQSFRDCSTCPEMVVVPAGRFAMGSPANEKERFDNEDQLQVSIARPFAVGKFAVTRGEFAAFAQETGHKAEGCIVFTGSEWKRQADKSWRAPGFTQDDRHPAVCVNWDDAKAYAAWLSKKTGRAYRLLSEAEREYVTRAGTTGPFWWGSAITPAQANYDGNGEPYQGGGAKGENRKRTVPVDSFDANPWGLFQVHGNVAEWTEDCWNDKNAANPGDGSAAMRGNCSRRVLRSGSWFNIARYLRAATRNLVTSDSRVSLHGFRVARALE